MVRLVLVTTALAVPAVPANILDTIQQEADKVREAGKALHDCLSTAEDEAARLKCQEAAETALTAAGVGKDEMRQTLAAAAQDAGRAVAGLTGKAEEDQCMIDAAGDAAKIRECKAARMQAVKDNLVAATGVAADAIKDSDVIRALMQSAAEEAAMVMKDCTKTAEECKTDAIAKFAEVLGKDASAADVKLEFERAVKEAADRSIAETLATCKKSGQSEETCNAAVGELLKKLGLTGGKDATARDIARAVEEAAHQYARDAHETCMAQENATREGCKDAVATAMADILGEAAAARAEEVIDENALNAVEDAVVNCRQARAAGGADATCDDLVTAFFEAAGKERPTPGSKEEKRADAEVRREAAAGIAGDLLDAVLAASPAEIATRLNDAKGNIKDNIDALFPNEDDAKRAKRAAEAMAEATKDFVGETLMNGLAQAEVDFEEATKEAKKLKESKRKEIKNQVATMLQSAGLSETETADSFIKKYFADEMASAAAACKDAVDAAAQKTCRETAMENGVKLGLMARELFGARDHAALREAVRIMVICKEAEGEDDPCKAEALEVFKAIVGVTEVDAETEAKIAELAAEVLLGNPTVVRVRKALKIAAKVAEAACSDETKAKILEKIKEANADAAAGVNFEEFCQQVDGGTATEYHYVIDMPAASQEEIDQAITDVDTVLQNLDVTGRRLATTVASSGTDQDSEECPASNTDCGADAETTDTTPDDTPDETGGDEDTTTTAKKANDSSAADGATTLSGVAAVALALGTAIYV